MKIDRRKTLPFGESCPLANSRKFVQIFANSAEKEAQKRSKRGGKVGPKQSQIKMSFGQSLVGQLWRLSGEEAPLAKCKGARLENDDNNSRDCVQTSLQAMQERQPKMQEQRGCKEEKREKMGKERGRRRRSSVAANALRPTTNLGPSCLLVWAASVLAATIVTSPEGWQSEAARLADIYWNSSNPM